MSDCAFCAIGRDRPPTLVHDGPDVVAFLDRAPLIKGHTLVVTRAHYETLEDVPAALLGPLLATVQRVARAFGPALGAEGSFLAANTRVSQSVAHVHMHVVPRRRGDGLFAKGPMWIRKRYAAGEAEEIAAALRAAISSSDGS